MQIYSNFDILFKLLIKSTFIFIGEREERGREKGEKEREGREILKNGNHIFINLLLIRGPPPPTFLIFFLQCRYSFFYFDLK